MFKWIICILSLLCVLPVQAGEFENELIAGNKVLLYMSASNCSYCKQFNPIYEKLGKQFGTKYKFMKIDADTPYGTKLMYDMGAVYIPYVAIINGKERLKKSIHPSCAMDIACISQELKKF